MTKTIAVEDNLSPFKEFLEAKGCQVIDVGAAANQKVDAVVLSGADENLMNMQDVVVGAPVINAKGLSPEEVWEEISKR